MKKATRSQLIDALCDVLDGEDAYSLKANTLMSIERCDEIFDIAGSVRKEWLEEK